jgi:hypothetical protein
MRENGGMSAGQSKYCPGLDPDAIARTGKALLCPANPGRLDRFKLVARRTSATLFSGEAESQRCSVVFLPRLTKAGRGQFCQQSMRRCYRKHVGKGGIDACLLGAMACGTRQGDWKNASGTRGKNPWASLVTQT